MRILLISRKLVMGGVERSLVEFIDLLVKDGHHIDLFILQKGGELFDKLNKNINIIYNEQNDKYSNKVLNFLLKVKNKVLRTLHINKNLKHEKILLEKQYDLGIAYQGTDYDLMEILLRCVKAKQKLALLHGDPSFIKKDILKNMFKADKILCISKSLKQKLVEKFSWLKNKTYCMYNPQSIDRICEESKGYDVDFGSGVNFVTIARLSKEKAHLRSLKIFKELHDEGYIFKWHIIGDGPFKNKIKKYIKRKKMEDYVFMYGNKTNPYPYIKSANITYLGSYHESFGMVLVESLSLGVPVITTNTVSANEVAVHVLEDKEQNFEEIQESGDLKDFLGF